MTLVQLNSDWAGAKHPITKVHFMSWYTLNQILLVHRFLQQWSLVVLGCVPHQILCCSHFLSESSTRNKQHGHSSRNSFSLLSLSLLPEQNSDLHLESSLETYPPDPMLSVPEGNPEDDLLLYLNNPNLFDDTDILQDEHMLPEFSLQAFPCLPQQPCGNMFR